MASGGTGVAGLVTLVLGRGLQRAGFGRRAESEWQFPVLDDEKESLMPDVASVLLTVALFTLLAVVVRAVDRL